MRMLHPRIPHFAAVPAAFLVCLSTFSGPAQTLGPDFSSIYSVRDVGAAGDVPSAYGAVVFKAGDPETLLVAGSMGDLAAKIYQVKVTRDAQKHITGFAATASFFADATGVNSGWGIDGGMDYAPNGVLFYTSTHEGGISQIKPGSTAPGKQVLMSDLGMDGGGGGLLFVPAGFPGAGRLKLSGAASSSWYDTTVTADGGGTYDIAPVGNYIEIVNYGQGLAYVQAGKPAFAKSSVLIASMQNDRIVAYEVDANGDPVASTLRDFLTDYYLVTGITVDPITGDFLAATSDGNSPHIVLIGNLSVSQTQVHITAPAEGSSFTAPATFPVNAEATQPGGSIARVDIYQDTKLLASVSGGSYSTLADSLLAGQYAFTAVAFDGGGNATTSAPVHISVVNNGPGITLVYPTNNTTLAACTDLRMVANLQPGNSEIASVTFFDGSTILGVSHEAYDFQPYRWSELDLDAGTRIFSVMVTDKNGFSSVAVATNVVILPLQLNKMTLHHYATNQLKFCFRGQTGSNYVWESTTNLMSPKWAPFQTNTATAGRLQVTNTLDSHLRSQYFRSRQAN